jgi:hypothetical protein
MFSQIRPRVITHKTTSTLPCRGGGDGGGLLYIVYHHTRYHLFGGPERIPTQITLMDIAKRPLLTRERR